MIPMIGAGRVPYSLRSLRRDPTYTAVSVASLALGIAGAVIALSVVASVLFRELPYRDPDRLVSVMETTDRRCATCADLASRETWEYWRDNTTSVFSVIGRYRSTGVLAHFDRDSVEVDATAVDGNVFPMLGTQPLLGRTILPDDCVPGASPVAVLSRAVWAERYRDDRSVLGSVLRLDGRAFTVVGVMPESFRFPRAADLWIADQATPSGAGGYIGIARLKAGATLERAHAVMVALADRRHAELETHGPRRGATVLSVVAQSRLLPAASLRLILRVALATVVLTCANVYNLSLVRMLGRHHELAVRSALGATKSELLRLVATEGLIISLFGGVGALTIVWLAGGFVEKWIMNRWSTVAFVSLGPTTIAATLGGAMLLGVALSVTPAVWRAGRDVRGALHSSSAGITEGRSGTRFRRAIVVAQIGTTILLVGLTVILFRSYTFISSFQMGYDSEGLQVATIGLPATRARVWDGLRDVADAALTRLAGSPLTAKNTAWVFESPSLTAGPDRDWITIDGSAERLGELARPYAFYHVDEEFFATIGLPIVRGRSFDRRDVAEGASIAIVNEVAARRWWGADDPIGKRILLGDRKGGRPWLTVVGVVRNSRPIDASGRGFSAARPDLFLPMVFVPIGVSLDPIVRPTSSEPSIFVAVRAERGQHAQVTRALSGVLEEVGTGATVSKVSSLRELQVRRDYGFELLRFSRNVVAGLTSLCALLAVLGVYGVVADDVTRRRREFGILRALGARDRHIAGSVARLAVALAMAGVATGLAATLGLHRIIASEVFNVRSVHSTGLLYGDAASAPAVFLSVMGAMTLVILVSTAIPLFRALRASPLAAMRE
jgi:putative ABC transport system permease protein